MILNIIQNLPMHKKSKEILGVIVKTIIEVKVFSVREMARKAIGKMFVNPFNYSSNQALANRISRFFNSHKWNYLKVQLSLAQFILNRLSREHVNIHVLTDFTYLEDKWRILSFAVPVGGRAIPILTVPVRKDAFSNLEWKSEVELVIQAISLLLPLLPKGTVFTFDREFTFPALMEFLKANGMYFVIRLKKTVYVDNKPLTELPPGIYEDVTVHKTKANVYLKGYLNINGKIDFYAYVSNLPKEKLTWELYKERMKIEEMFKDEKNLFKLEYFSYVTKTEVLGRWLTVFLIMLLSIYLLSRIKTDDHRVKLLWKELEEKKISFVRYAMELTDIYSVTLKVSKTGRLVLIASKVQK